MKVTDYSKGSKEYYEKKKKKKKKNIYEIVTEIFLKKKKQKREYGRVKNNNMSIGDKQKIKENEKMYRNARKTA